MLLQTCTNEMVVADGTLTPAGARSGRQGDVIVSELHGRMFEQAFRKRTYRMTIAALTVAATHASPLVAGTGTPILGLYNPPGSGVLVEVVKLIVATTSGTPGGPLLWNYTVGDKITQAPTANVAIPSQLAAATGSKIQAFNNVATTGSSAGLLAGIAYPIRAVAAAGGEGPGISYEEGELQALPGVLLALAATAAGTTHIMGATLVWNELPFTA